MEVKKTWEEITLGEFQKLVEISQRYVDKKNDTMAMTDYGTEVLSVLTGKEFEEIETLPIDEYKDISAYMGFLNEKPTPSELKTNYDVGGVKYNISKTIGKLTPKNVREMKAIQYIDLLGLHQQKKDENDASNLHMILAVCMIPDGKTYGEFDVMESANYLQEHLNIRDAIAVQAFFLTAFNILTSVTATYFEGKKRIKPKQKEMLTKIQSLKSRADSWLNGVGDTIYRRLLKSTTPTQTQSKDTESSDS